MERESGLQNRQIEGARPRGRPRVCAGAVQRVDIRLPAPLYDALDRHARQADSSVPDVIRRVLTRNLPSLD